MKYDGEMIEFRTLNYAKLLRLMRTQPVLTLEDMTEELGISMTAVRKLVNQLIEKNYVEKNEKDSSWRVIITPFDSAMRSLIVAIYELGVEEIMVVAHSQCGACHMSYAHSTTS